MPYDNTLRSRRLDGSLPRARYRRRRVSVNLNLAKGDSVHKGTPGEHEMADELKLTELQRLVDEYVSERGWRKYHKPKDIAISIAVESSELLELFQWKRDPVESGRLDDALRARLGEEVADIVIYCACMANALSIDLSEALLHKIEKNRGKYPAGEVSKLKDWDEVRSVCRIPSEGRGDD